MSRVTNTTRILYREADRLFRQKAQAEQNPVNVDRVLGLCREHLALCIPRWKAAPLWRAYLDSLRHGWFGGYNRRYFTIDLPSDCEEDPARRFDLAVLQAKEEFELYVMPARWTKVRDDGETVWLYVEWNRKETSRE